MVASSTDFSHLDLNAAPGLTDGPAAAAAEKRCRDNLAASWVWRFPEAGTPFVELEPSVEETGGQARRWSSAFPVAYGPFPLWVAESMAEARVQLTCTQVDWSIDSTPPAAGSDAVLVHATIMTPDGRYDLPPDDFGDWALDLDYEAAASTTIREIRIPLRGRTGWVFVLVWVKSYLHSTQEKTGAVVEIMNWGAAAVIFTGGPPAVTGQVPERALIWYPSTGEAQGIAFEPEGPTRQICRYQVSASAAVDWVCWVAPPFFSQMEDSVWNAGANQVLLYTMGVLRIEGVSVNAEPTDAAGTLPDMAPAEALFYNDEPCSHRGPMPLAQQTDRLICERVPQFSGLATSRDQQWVRIIGVSSSYQAIRAWFIGEQENDEPTTYEVIVGLYAASAGPVALGRELMLDLRLNAYTPLGASQDTQDLLGQRVDVHEMWGMTQWWMPLAHNHFGLNQFWGAWHYTGVLIAENAPFVSPPVADPGRIAWFRLEIEEDGWDYPVVLKLEAKRSGSQYLSNVLFLCAALRRKGLAE